MLPSNALRRVLGALVLLFLSAAALAQAPGARLEQVAEFSIREANQGVGVDARHFYAIDDRAIGKYDKVTGALVKRWEGPAGGPIIHLDSALLKDGKLYAAHSNWPHWPMTSSIEIWDAETLEHIGSHSFGVHRGSLTWLDWHDGHWWATYANYDRLYGPGKTPYGHKANTQVVKMTADFREVQSWVLPKALLDRFADMSNSGGSWGPDGKLYLSGHDPAEVYRMRFPKAGSILEVEAILPVNIRGQGIAWDRSAPGTLYGVVRATAREREAGIGHKVTVSRLLP